MPSLSKVPRSLFGAHLQPACTFVFTYCFQSQSEIVMVHVQFEKIRPKLWWIVLDTYFSGRNTLRNIWYQMFQQISSCQDFGGTCLEDFVVNAHIPRAYGKPACIIHRSIGANKCTSNRRRCGNAVTVSDFSAHRTQVHLQLPSRSWVK